LAARRQGQSQHGHAATVGSTAGCRISAPASMPSTSAIPPLISRT